MSNKIEEIFTRLNAAIFKAQHADKLDGFGYPRFSDIVQDYPDQMRYQERLSDEDQGREYVSGVTSGKAVAFPLFSNRQPVIEMLDAAKIDYTLGAANEPLPGDEKREGKTYYQHIEIDLNQPGLEEKVSRAEAHVMQKEQATLIAQTVAQFQKTFPNASADDKKSFIEQLAVASGLEKPLFKGRSGAQPVV